jgi:hypothetical protein
MIQISVLAVDTLGWRHLVVPTNAMEFWTVALTLATVGLGGVAYFGLRSLSLSKKDMRNRATREETQCAIDRCNEMGRELLPLFTDILHDLTAKKIPVFVRDTSQVSFRKEEEDPKVASAIKWVGLLDSKSQNATIELLNRLECWAMFFTTNPALASEKLAFEPCSTVFCQMVMVL